MEDQSNVEKIAGSLTVNSVLTMIATYAPSMGTMPLVYLSALLPILSASMAGARHAKRMESAFKDIDIKLRGMQSQIASISDAQYKFINESIITLSHTTDDNKISLLKAAIVNGVKDHNISDHEASIVSRVIRDISWLEAMKLIEVCNYKDVIYLPENGGATIGTDSLFIKDNSVDSEVINGLINLGLLVAGASGWGGTIKESLNR